MDPNPDYDASDEVEYFFTWLPWALRGVYPPARVPAGLRHLSNQPFAGRPAGDARPRPPR